MANAGDLVDQLTRRKGMFSARDVLFPELGAVPVGRLAEGILRAPRRGWRSPPILSACAPERSTPSALPAGLTTSSRLLAETGWEFRSCWRVRPRPGRQWSRRGSAVRGGWPAPNRRCPRAALPWSRSPNPTWPIPPPTVGQIPRRRLRCSVLRYRPTVPSRSSYLPSRGPPLGCTRRLRRREHVAPSSSNAHATPGRCSIAPIASTASEARLDFSGCWPVCR